MASRPNSFFGLDSPKSIDLSLGPEIGVALGEGRPDDGQTTTVNGDGKATGSGKDAQGRTSSTSVPYPPGDPDAASTADESAAQPERVRPSSFFGMEQQPLGHVPNPVDSVTNTPSSNGQRSADAANGRVSPTSIAPSQSASNYGGSADRSSGTTNGATRPASIAPTVSGALLDHSHLRPGEQAALLSHNKTLELYRQNAKKTNDPELVFELAVFMIEAAKSMGGDDSSGGSGPTGSGGSSNGGHQNKDESARDDLVKEAIGLLKKIADRGHPDAQYFLADCYANGIGTSKGKQDFDKAYPLFVLAAKHGHPDASYRAGMCYEKGWGCRRDAAKAVQFYRKAGAQSHPGAMYRLGTAELNGDLGLKKSAREGVKWLKRSADAATPEFPHALHELALLHERGVDNVLFADPEYACELLAQGGEMGYAPSAYKLGVNYEYGRMGCPQDAGLSIHMYNIAAQQNHKEACFALTAWYLVGAPGILPQSDTEAYLWAKKAAEQGLAKAEYAVGYFTEMGIGTVRDMGEARSWHRAAAEHGDKRANQRLASLGVPQPEQNRLFASLGIRRGSEPSTNRSNGDDASQTGVSNEPPLPQKGINPREQGMRLAAAEALRQQQQQQQQQLVRNQPLNAPFPSAVERSAVSPASSATSSYPNPMQMKETQTAQRDLAHQVAVMRTQQQQQIAMQYGRPPVPLSKQAGQQVPLLRSPIPPGLHSGSDSNLPGIRSPLSSSSSQVSASSGLSPQLQLQFQNMHMRGPGTLPQPPSLQNGQPGPLSGGPGSPPQPSPRPPRSHPGHGGGSGSFSRKAPHGAEVAYLLQNQQRQPPPGQGRMSNGPPGGHAGPFPPFHRPPNRQNSAPPGPQPGGPYPTYNNQPNPERTYRPGIPVVQQPMPQRIGSPSSDADSFAATTDSHTTEKRKQGLWAQLKAM